MKVSLDISVSSRLWRELPRARAIARETIAAAAESAGPGIDRPEGRASLQTPYGGDVSLCLADDAALRALNARWRGIDKPTNVLSFLGGAAFRRPVRPARRRYRRWATSRSPSRRSRARPGSLACRSPTIIATLSPMDFCI